MYTPNLSTGGENKQENNDGIIIIHGIYIATCVCAPVIITIIKIKIKMKIIHTVNRHK